MIQVLELSGIGGPDVLRKADVEVVVDLPGVGNNVQDHFNSGVSYRTLSHLESFELNAKGLSRGEGRV